MKFREMTTEERLQELIDLGVMSEYESHLLDSTPGLPHDVASNMVENQVGAFPVPLGLAEHFVIDGRPMMVPMAVEEPSVIAAAGNAAKRCQSSGGFITSASRGGIMGQVVFIGQLDDAQRFLDEHRAELKRVARDAHPSLEAHGGGLRDVRVKTHSGDTATTEFQLTVDPGESMGANVVNTICEAVAHYLSTQLPQLTVLMAILSNDAPLQTACAKARFPFTQLGTATMDGAEVAERIVQAGAFAEVSPQRAATQNKGIMNGVNALVLASGNDTRNVAAAAYAALGDRHRTWTHWAVDSGYLVGSIDIPLPIGAVGGGISTLPVAKLVMKLLANPDVKTLMGVTASVGLASNMAALRALVTQGIQAGHMNLQLRSLAIMAGAQGEKQIASLTQSLRQDANHADLQRAQNILRHIGED